jgi:hypothetical protein
MPRRWLTLAEGYRGHPRGFEAEAHAADSRKKIQ